jgi:hypothetical protein
MRPAGLGPAKMHMQLVESISTAFTIFATVAINAGAGQARPGTFTDLVAHFEQRRKRVRLTDSPKLSRVSASPMPDGAWL